MRFSRVGMRGKADLNSTLTELRDLSKHEQGSGSPLVIAFNKLTLSKGKFELLFWAKFALDDLQALLLPVVGFRHGNHDPIPFHLIPVVVQFGKDLQVVIRLAGHMTSGSPVADWESGHGLLDSYPLDRDAATISGFEDRKVVGIAKHLFGVGVSELSQDPLLDCFVGDIFDL